MYHQERLQRFLVVPAFALLLFQLALLPQSVESSSVPGFCLKEDYRPAETFVAQSSSKKHNYFDDFLIHGTVFNDKALAFPAVELRIRRTGEKKYHWETYTNSRGDFAIRVPKGSDYEILVHAKGFTDQTQTIDAKTGEDDKLLAFRMELPVAGGKK